jgi:hypothetical protein
VEGEAAGMTRRYPKRTPARDIRNSLAFLAGETQMEAPKPKRATPKRQPESASVDAVKEWARLRGGVLYKNPRGVAGYMPPGMPVGLGPNGFPDCCGYLPITITPSMIGTTLPVATFIEVKRVKLKGKQLEADDHQQEQINIIAAANGITGTARTAEDCERIWEAWFAQYGARKST